ncbi:nucleoside deaminase [Amphritea opalescens]|uniref:Nucleoside deaminase n=1 Tax=Amphritea opalescens TaxID=2490544 RepID=A0A430KST8_9GAMM|nr:nucleoside deaminase [Amphritea opalescens]RTE66393.1 nucleoside deaminase [Amphritea opalescens]
MAKMQQEAASPALTQDDKPITSLIKRLNQLQPDSEYRDDIRGLYACRLALDALEQGNYGVAALLVDPQGEVVAQSENRVFSEDGQGRYHSQAHAEMLLVDQLEAGLVPYPPEQLTLLVTLEPCPMCLARLLLSGIGSVRYMADDQQGGMLTHADKLPPAWRNLMQLQHHYKAHVSTPVRLLAGDIATTHQERLRRKLLTYIRP